MEDMLHHTKAVVRSTSRALIVADLPFMSYQADRQEAMRNAGRLLQEGGAQAVKLEGGTRVASTVRRIVEAGIPVMGHIGLTPQSINQLGGYRVQGKTSREGARLLEDALDLEAAGAFAIVLELVPTPLASLVTQQLRVPTIGIGAGAGCDGQVLVLHDMLGLTTDFKPRHAKRYVEAAQVMQKAVERFMEEVQLGTFPAGEHTTTMGESLLPEPSRRGRFELPSV
jgi:3-methyl-2-oxobutanoate hydroxymethyltransferase